MKSIYKDQFDSIKKTRVRTKEHSDSLIAQINAKSVENSDLNAQLQEKVFAVAALKNEIRKLKGKNIVDTSVSTPIATTIALGMFKLDIEPISHRLKNNRDAHEDYLKKTIENTKTIRGLKPVDSNITKDSNKPSLHSTKVKCSTGASGSKPSGNTINNRISQSSSSNKTNKVEDQTRSVKSRKNKNNRVEKTECNARVMQSMLNANSVSEPINNARVKHSVRNDKFESICAICNKCLFDANHDMCLIDYMNDVNVRSKSKSKRNKKRKVWKPTGKVFTEIGYKWKPTGRTFTIYGNRCPLTRITSTKVVPLKETIIKSVDTPNPELKVYSRKPKASRSVGSISKVKIVESKTSNTKEPNQSWGSTISDVPSSSLIECRFRNDHIAKIMGYGDYQMGNILRQYDASFSNLSLVQSLKYQILVMASNVVPPKLRLHHYSFQTSEDQDFDELTAMASEQFSSGPGPQLLTPGTISSGLVPQPPSPTPNILPTKDDWDVLFQPMFDEFFKLPPSVDHHVPSVAAEEPVVSTVEPKSYKDALIESCWIEAMQEELNEFERLEVWDLVPRPDWCVDYTLKWIYKYVMETVDPVDTPMVEKSKLDKDLQGKAVVPTRYHGMIGSLMYLTASRPDLVFVVCMCAWYQAKPTEKHLHAVKRIFSNLRGTINMGLWYLKDSYIALTAYADADHAGCQDTKKIHREVYNSWEIDWCRQRNKRALQYLVQKLNTLPYQDVEQVENRVVELYFFSMEYQLAGIFTKPLARERLEFLMKKLGMRSMSPEMLKKLADEEEE
ncbi:hypothetical protein Tco_0519777 [Tanacetum coccineum]